MGGEGRELAPITVEYPEIETVLSVLVPGSVTMTNVAPQRSFMPGRIAQLEERGPYKAEVPGSIPGPPTRKIISANSLGIFGSESLPNFNDAVRGWK